MADTSPLPTAEQALGKSPLPTAEDALGPDPSTHKGVFSGALSDAYFALGAPNRILSSFNQGAAEAWGATQSAFAPDSDEWIKSHPLPKEYHEGRSTVLKAANESWMRSAAHGIYDNLQKFGWTSAYTQAHPLSTLVGAVAGVAQGVPAAFEQTGQELGNLGSFLNKVGTIPVMGKPVGLGTPFAAAGELASGVAQGAYLPEAPHAGFLDRGRSLGSHGEPEGKYFGTVDLTARDHAARAEALGQTVSATETPPSIHEAARKYAPEAFEHYDVLQDHRQVFQDQLQKSIDEQANDPERKAAQNRIDEILDQVNHDESELTEERANELSQLRDKVEVDSPAVADARKTLSNVEGRITDLTDHIHEAYQLAKAGDRPLFPEGDSRNEPAAVTISPERPAKSAAELAEGEIAKDVEKKLLKAGRPADEAKIAGILWQQRYENRVGKSPHLGTPEELYKKEGPDILRGNQAKSSEVDTLFQTALKKNQLVVALQNDDGSVRYGKPGQTHADLFTDEEYTNGKFNWDNTGWAEGEGQPFLSRKEASELVSEDLKKSGGKKEVSNLTDTNYLEAIKYNSLLEKYGQSTLDKFLNIFRGIHKTEFLQESPLVQKVSDLAVDKAHPSDWLHLIDTLKESAPDTNWSKLKSWIGKEYRNGNKEITKEDLISHIGNNQELFQQKQGSLTLSNPRNVLRLFRSANASTFFHETGHQWLEELMQDASHEKASLELKTDAETVRSFLGPRFQELRDTVNKTKAEQREYANLHERWARGFERYLREGHAPTKELAVLFQRFKEWLTSIYKTLRDLPNSKINDSIRDVFDRLIVPERTRDVVAPELEQRQSARQRERDIQTHIQDIKEQARSRQIFKYMEEARERVKEQQASKASTKRNIVGPDGKSPEGKPLPEPTPVESEVGTAEIVSDNPAEKGPVESPNAELKTTSGPLVDNAGNIRIENLTSDQDLADAIQLAYEANKDELDKSRGKINSQATIDLASAGGIATKDVNMKALIRSAENGGIPLSSYISILRNAFLESAKSLKAVMAGEDEVAYAEASTRHMALSRHLMGITAEWGRAGHSFRSLAEEARQAQELNEFMQMSIGKSLKQLKREMRFGRYLDTSAKVSGFVQDMSKEGYGEWILEMYKNWLISGPITHTTYAIGNQIFALNRLLESAARVGISALREEHVESSHLGEVRERTYGLMSGQLDGLRAAWDSFKAGETALLPGEERATTAFTQHRAIPDFKVGNVPLPLGSAIRLPSERMVAPLHSFARSVAFMEERNGLIYRQAVKEGLEGDALERRIAELKTNVPVDITVAARAAASEAALMGRAGEFTRKAVAFVNSELNLPKWAGGTWRPGGFIAPFITVSSNINRLALLERSPIGFLSQAVRDDITGVNGRFKQDVAISKMAVGTSIGIAAGTLYGMEMANPAPPEDFKHATVLQAINGLPHSIRIGEMSYDLSRLGVLGTTFSSAIDIAALGEGLYKAYYKGDRHIAQEAAVQWYHAMKEHLESEGFLSGISDLMKAANDGDRYGESWVKNFVSSLVIPYSVGMSQMAQRLDPLQRDTRGVDTLDSISRAIRAKIPFESQTLESKVDLFGQPVPAKEYWGVYATRMSQDPVWTALKDVGYFPAPVKRTINAVKLTPEQYHDYATKAGITSKMLLDNVVNMQGFDQLDGQIKHALIKDAITSGRSTAAQITIAESIGTENDINEKATKLKEEIGKTE